MIGKKLSEFITELYNNPEIKFIYCDERYIISGFVDSTEEFYTLELSSISHNNLLFSETNVSREHCVERFEKAKIFNDRTKYDIESKIEVLYG